MIQLYDMCFSEIVMMSALFGAIKVISPHDKITLFIDIVD